MRLLKVSRCSHANESLEVEGAVVPTGSEEVLTCEMCRAALCGEVIRWGARAHGKRVRRSRISVAQCGATRAHFHVSAAHLTRILISACRCDLR